jgi:hypothetical protein
MKKNSRGFWAAVLTMALLGAHGAASGQSSAPGPAPAARQAMPAANIDRGKEIEGLDVLIRAKPGGATQTTRTDARGRFVFSHLPPGTYAISFPPPTTLTNPMAKSFFESRSNVNVAVTVEARNGTRPPVLASGPLAEIAVTGSGGAAARTARANGEIPITIGAGESVLGHVTAAP